MSTAWMNHAQNRNKGIAGEREVTKYLKSQGYTIVARNYRTKYGEIDIIALDGEYLVFVEVKSRLSNQYGNPVESVDTTKQKRIIKSAKAFWYFGAYREYQPRFDVVEVFYHNGQIKINAIENAYGET